MGHGQGGAEHDDTDKSEHHAEILTILVDGL